MFGRHADCLVQIPCFDDEKSPHLLLRLGERPVRDRRSAVRGSYGNGRTYRSERGLDDEMATLAQLLVVGRALTHDCLELGLGQGIEELFVVVSEAKVFHDLPHWPTVRRSRN